MIQLPQLGENSSGGNFGRRDRGGGIFAYRYFTHPITLTVAVVSGDGTAAQMMSSIATRLTNSGASVRLKVLNVDSAFEAAKQFSAGRSISRSFARMSATCPRSVRLF